MRRILAYVGEQVYEWGQSAPDQNTMTAIAKVCAAMLGTNVIVNGLACGPTSPATMTVQIGAGEMYQLEQLEATTAGTLPPVTNYSIVKQGIQLGTYTTATFATPGTSGQSINFLVQAQYQDQDISLDPTTGNEPVVLQFYNSTNPATPWSGPNNSGSTSNTFRDGIIAYQTKPGTAAVTGTQTTPSPDTGWTGLWVVTVPYGATSLTSANISQYTGAPILPSGLLQSVINGNLLYGVDNGTANVVQASFPLPSATLTDNQPFWVKIKNANTGATTFTPNPGVVSASPVVGAAHLALQGNELVANGRALFVWRQDISSYVLIECTGGSLQVGAATQSDQALQLGQATGRLLNVQVFTSSGTYTPISSLVTSVIVEGVGGGAGSGGTTTTTSNGSCVAGAGGSGTYAKARFTSGFTGGIAVTVGAAGAAGTSAPSGGGAGGTTSLGGLMSIPGGSASGAGGVTTTTGVAAGSSGGAAATITNAAEVIVNLPGQGGTTGVCLAAASSTVAAGNGGSNPLGSGGIGNVGGGARAAAGYGAGAPGQATGISTAATGGFVGTQGTLIVYEYA